MAFRSKKEQQQVILLVAVLAIIFCVGIYFYRDKLLPKPVGGGAGAAPPARMDLPTAFSTEVFDRTDFRALKKFGDVPVRPLQKGSTELFNELMK